MDGVTTTVATAITAATIATMTTVSTAIVITAEASFQPTFTR